MPQNSISWDSQRTQTCSLVLLGLFLSMYLVTVLGNLLIILAVSYDSHLHNPMYFFLSILSLADIGFISSTVPKVIMDIQSHSKVISYVHCLTQMSSFIICGCMDEMLLTAMAYDRFVAICHPLHYPVIMNLYFYGFLVLVSLGFSLLESQMQKLIALRFVYFKDMDISNFFCDPSQILSLSCSDALTRDIVMYFVGLVYGFLPFSGIIFSYYKIVSSVLRIPSLGRKYKAFSTCGSHLSVVCLFYGTAIGVYFSSDPSSITRKGVVSSVMYTVATPMLNPFIYSLNNRDIRSALWRLHRRTV